MRTSVRHRARSRQLYTQFRTVSLDLHFQIHNETEGLSYIGPDESFRYTLDLGLTKEQRRFYDENGFLVIRKLVPLEKLDNYR